MLATIRDDTWNVLNMQPALQIRQDGIIQTSPVVAPPTWVKVATALEKPPTPTQNYWEKKRGLKIEQ